MGEMDFEVLVSACHLNMIHEGKIDKEGNESEQVGMKSISFYLKRQSSAWICCMERIRLDPSSLPNIHASLLAHDGCRMGPLLSTFNDRELQKIYKEESAKTQAFLVRVKLF